MVKAVITQVQPTEDYCNLTVECAEPRKLDGHKDTFTLNAAAVEKVVGAEPAVEPEPEPEAEQHHAEPQPELAEEVEAQ